MRSELRCVLCGSLPLLLAALGIGSGPGCDPPPRATVKAPPILRSTPPPAKQSPRPPRLYVVRDNDTLARIAARFGVLGRYAELARLNNIKYPYYVSSGLMLRIPVRRGFTDPLRRFPRIRVILGPWRPCGAKLGRPRRVPVAGCRTAYCAKGTEAGERLCRCLGPTIGGEHFWYERKGRRHKLRSSQPAMFSRPWTFSATRTDLDGDGKDELILANHRTTSNGIAIMWFDVEVYAPGRRNGPQVHYANAGGQDPVRRRLGDRLCSLRAVSFESQPGLWRGEGNFWVQRLYRYRRGRLLPHPKALVRRSRLGGPRFAVCSSPHPSTAHNCRRFSTEVGLAGEWWHHAGRVQRRVLGRVGGITSEHVVFKPRRGPPQKLSHWLGGSWLGRFGDRRTRRLYPAEYSTADRKRHWIGRRVARVTYRAGSSSFEVLWLSRGPSSSLKSKR